MKIKLKENILIFLFLLFIGIVIFKWSEQYTISTLEDLRLSRAHQALYSFRPYFPHVYKWMKDLGENKIYEFSLGYFLPTPFLFFMGDIPGFRFSHIISSLITVFLIFFILREHFKYSFRISLLSSLILLTSYGFIFLMTYTSLDQFAFMFFFAFIYFYFKNKNFLAGMNYLFAILSKDPRIILSSLPAFTVFVIIFDKQQLKIKKNWAIVLFLLTIFLMVQKFSQGIIVDSFIDSFPFRLTNSDFRKYISSFFSDFNKFHLEHLYRIFFTAPVLTIFALIGLTDFFKKKILKIEKLLLLSFVTIALLYFSARDNGPHYIYFAFLFLTPLVARYIKNTTLFNGVIICWLSLMVLLFSLQGPICFNRFKINEIKKLKIDLLPYSDEGFILSHGFDWGRYFHNRRWGNIWDWEWSGNALEIKNLPGYVENNIRLVAVKKERLPIFINWEKSKDYRLVKNFEDWEFFIPAEK